MNLAKRVFYKIKYSIHKLLHWEYWPQEVVYAIIYPYYAWMAFRLRAAGFFVVANPHDGEMNFLMESKIKIYKHIPVQYYPTTIYVEPKQDFNLILNEIKQVQISYPLITKPNVGHKGIGVKKIMNETELITHHQSAKHPYLIQRLVEFQHEIGLFWVRFPNEERGKLTGIVYKEYLHVIGDGKRTLEQLIYADARTYYQLPYLSTKFKNEWNTILQKDEKLIIVPFGSHFRGSKFIDCSHKITPKLTESFNNICRQIPGYHFGRMDIKFDNWKDLEDGKKFAIIETNGAGSEPTHIYDPTHSIFFAWKEIVRHLYYLKKVCVQNKQKGYKTANLSELLKMYSNYKVYMKEIE
ncbi:MAG: D-alanine--D-alanine ligase [Chitinophagales bacterium]|nr:D-alanine--D-alanine ligase [Chitinophagales bacterium]